MSFRHTAEHDAWTPDGRCDEPVLEPDGNVTRCGYRRDIAQLDLQPEEPLPSPPPRISALRVVVAVATLVLGIAIALDWLAFVLFVMRHENNPNLATAFVFRVAASALYGAAVVWLWRRR